MISQFKKRRNAIIYIAKKVNSKFAIKYSNAILISKIIYHLEVWGLCSRSQVSAINKIMIETASYLTKIKYGHTDVFILAQIKWKPLDQLYEDSIIKNSF